MIKKYMYRIVLFSAIATLFFSSDIYAKNDYHVEAQPRVIEAAQKIEQMGMLKQKKNGYLYVEVSRDFISKVLPLIEAKGKMTPPGHCTTKKGIGPHISVIYDKEVKNHKIGAIREVGQAIIFHVKELRTVHVRQDNTTRKLWLLAVDAPLLEGLRVRYGLSPKLQGHDFHITLAYETQEKADRKATQSESNKIEFLQPELAETG